MFKTFKIEIYIQNKKSFFYKKQEKIYSFKMGIELENGNVKISFEIAVTLLVLTIIGFLICIPVLVLIILQNQNLKQQENMVMEIIPNYDHAKFAIYLCCYDDHTENLAKSYADKYSYFRIHRLKQSVYLENELYFWLAEHPEELQGLDWVGSLASTFENKISFWAFDKILHIAENKNIDLVYFKGERRGVSIKEASLWHHPDIIGIFEKTFQSRELNYDINKILNDKTLPIFYCNYWAMKTKHLSTFLKDILKIKRLWKESFTITKLLFKDSKYGRIPNMKLAEYMGTPWYTYHCFVLERFPSLFCGQYNLKTWNPYNA